MTTQIRGVDQTDWIQLILFSTQVKTGRKSVPPPPFGSARIGSDGRNSWEDWSMASQYTT
jgi:hypothetical protein